jgi:hypothetical protein
MRHEQDPDPALTTAQISAFSLDPVEASAANPVAQTAQQIKEISNAPREK